MSININDLPSDYVSDVQNNIFSNINKYEIQLLKQEGQDIYCSFNSNILSLYRGNTLRVEDTLSNSYIAIVKSINVNELVATIIYDTESYLPAALKVTYHEWWENSTPSAQILDYIFINPT